MKLSVQKSTGNHSLYGIVSTFTFFVRRHQYKVKKVIHKMAISKILENSNIYIFIYTQSGTEMDIGMRMEKVSLHSFS